MSCPAPHRVRAIHWHFRMNPWRILWNKDKNQLGCFPYKKIGGRNEGSEPEEPYQVSDSWNTWPKAGISVLRFLNVCKPRPALEIHELQMFWGHRKTGKHYQIEHGKFIFLRHLLLVTASFFSGLPLAHCPSQFYRYLTELPSVMLLAKWRILTWLSLMPNLSPSFHHPFYPPITFWVLQSF